MTDQSADVNTGKYIGIFAITYIAVSVVTSVVLQFFEVERNIGISIGILMASAFFVANKFVGDNNRVPTKGEKFNLVGGSLVIVVIASILGIYVISLIEDVPFGELMAVFTEISSTLLAIGAAIILGINWLVLSFAYGFGAKKIAESKNIDASAFD